ncbi:MAG: hypothetical protein O6830_00620 [Candidatus Dadabacteria bacterium]|nr:hypothetical protein [Candidatus Dadabacteria bacterium]
MQPISFISNDNLLRESIEHEVTHPNFNAYESISNFQSTLDLKKQNLEAMFIRKITRSASEKFFKRSNPKSLFLRDDIRGIINEKYRNDIDNPKPSIGTRGLLSSLTITPVLDNWEPSNEGIFRIYRPSFKKVENEKDYYWVSTVSYVRKYRMKNTLIDKSEDDQYSERIHILDFNVNWKSNVARDGRFLKYEYLDVDLKDVQYRPITEEDKRKWALD